MLLLAGGSRSETIITKNLVGKCELTDNGEREQSRHAEAHLDSACMFSLLLTFSVFSPEEECGVKKPMMVTTERLWSLLFIHL